MRDLSDQEIKELYESEYKNVPDVWDKVSCRIEQQGQEAVHEITSRDDGEDTVLHFAKLGRKRGIMMVATLAACCFIVCAYVLQNGSLMMHNSKSDNAGLSADEVPMTESAGQGDFDMIQSDADDAATGDAIDYAAQPEVAEEAGEDENSSDLQKNDTEMLDAESVCAMLNVNGVVYYYDGSLRVTAAELENMKTVGKAVYVMGEDTPTRHLTITGMDIQGMVFESDTGEMYILEDDTKQVYGFR